MHNGNYALIVDGSPVPLRPVENIRLVTPARDEHPATVAARLARSSRLALDPTYPPEWLVVRGDRQKLEEVPSYRDIQNTRAAFQDLQGNLLVLTNDILISFESEASDEDREGLLRSLDGRVIERKARFWKFRLDDPGEDAPLLLAMELSDQSIVKYAEPNALQAARFQQLPASEPRFGNQWTLLNIGQNGGTFDADVDAQSAWNLTTGSPDIGIVVHDSGVDMTHPDLVANLRPGWDFDNDDNDPTPDLASPDAAHGTACAGIIAAAVNGQGVTGIAPNCQIIPLKAAGNHPYDVWAETFDWAASRGRIISVSWKITENNVLTDAIRDAVNIHGVTVICGTGNDFWPFDDPHTISYPASLAETIAVGASTSQDVRARYSQVGSGIDVVAPSSGPSRDGTLTLRVETTDLQGTNGYNTANSPDGDYCNANDDTGFGGTSAATPLTAGIAGLMLSFDPSLSPAQIRAYLQESADKIDPQNADYDANGWDIRYGFGRVNAAAAVRRVDPYVQVPLVRDLRPTQAGESVSARDLVPKFTGDPQGPNAWVWRQSPDAGTQVLRLSTVSMQLRTGPIQ